MLFSSPTFLFAFLPLSLGLYFAARGTAARNRVLLGLSLAFYAWGEPAMILVMLGSIVFNHAAGLLIDRCEGGARHGMLALAVAANLLLLGLFKYSGFVLASLGVHGRGGGPALPLGISFFTFHALSYLIDVYRRRFAANRRLDQVALYIAFFPQLIAGPIVRYRTIAGRLAHRRHSWGRASAGLRLLVIGLAMKVLLADPLAPLAEAVFDHGRAPGLAAAWTGTLAYMLQIYFDFAGYSNMAIGLGLVFGFSLPRNFRLPYRSASITEFWRRWHITLSAWFRDYLYIPMGGNRAGAARTWFNLIVVFLLCGLWHGASWTFVLWGAWHGLFLALERAGLSRQLSRLPRPVGWAYAMLAVMFGWVLFRAPDLAGAVAVWRGLLGMNAAGFAPEFRAVFTSGQTGLMILGGLLAMFRVKAPPMPEAWRSAGATTGAGLVVALLALCILAVAVGGYSPFLYYRF